MTADLIGEVRGFARSEAPPGWLECDGSVLDIADHQPLFSLLGWRFGGDGRVTFGVPALGCGIERLRALTFGIAVNGLYPTKDWTMLETDHVGEIRLFAGTQAPAGWVPCDGRELPIAPPFMELYALIGTRYGASDDGERFAVPNLWSEDVNADGSVGRLSYIVAISSADADATT